MPFKTLLLFICIIVKLHALLKMSFKKICFFKLIFLTYINLKLNIYLSLLSSVMSREYFAIKITRIL